MKPLYFSNKILKWYNTEKRELPWREISNPYHIWISEVILQQTRIDQGINYYLRFIENFPSLESLATTEVDNVLKLWQGLGYYSRARNLHFASQQILRNFNGTFPETADELKKIKGIGDYTSAAIASIAFNEPVPAIDGNVYRVLSRIFGIEDPIDTGKGKKTFRALADQLIDKKHPGDFNQAVMEFGALHCKPRQPLCEECIFLNDCVAYSKQMIQKLPVKSKKTKVRNRYFYYLYIEQGNFIYFKKRTEKDIWNNLFDFPLVETSHQMNFEKITASKDWQSIFNDLPIEISAISDEVIHLLSHQRIHARFIHIQLISEKNLPTNFLKIDKRNIFDLAVPKIIENYLNSKMG